MRKYLNGAHTHQHFTYTNTVNQLEIICALAYTKKGTNTGNTQWTSISLNSTDTFHRSNSVIWPYLAWLCCFCPHARARFPMACMAAQLITFAMNAIIVREFYAPTEAPCCCSAQICFSSAASCSFSIHCRAKVCNSHLEFFVYVAVRYRDLSRSLAMCRKLVWATYCCQFLRFIVFVDVSAGESSVRALLCYHFHWKCASLTLLRQTAKLSLFVRLFSSVPCKIEEINTYFLWFRCS